MCRPDNTYGLFVRTVRTVRVRFDLLAGDLRANRGQLAWHVLVTPVDVPSVVKDALALRAQGSDDQRCARPDVGDGDLGPAQPGRTMHDRVEATFDVDPGSHLGQLV